MSVSCSIPRKVALPAEQARLRKLIAPACLLVGAALAAAQPAAAPDALTPAQAQALVSRTLNNELRAIQDRGHPMRFVLRKATPQLSTTKQIVETKDGVVARLIYVNDKPLSAAAEQNEHTRLETLLADPSQQRHRKQVQETDTGRALKVLRALPTAFNFQFVGAVETPAGKVEKFTFRPDPNYEPQDFETEVLTEMSGEMWIDAAQERVTRLTGSLRHDVNFGWGLLGRLYKGGWIAIEQAPVGNDQWRIVHFQMSMTGRVLFKTKVFDMTESETQFTRVPVDLTYAQAIQMLLNDNGSATAGYETTLDSAINRRPRPRGEAALFQDRVRSTSWRRR